jgi:homoserine kinase
MANKLIKVEVPATVANVSCGFDCIGYAISKPSDIVTIEKQDQLGIEISSDNARICPSNSRISG